MTKPLFSSPYPLGSVEQQYSRVVLARGYGRRYKVGEDRDFVFELSELSGLTFPEIRQDAEDYTAYGCGVVG